MKKTLFAISITLSLLLATLPSEAKPQKGFHTGPYLTVEFGLLQSDFDTDVAANQQIGRDFEPTAGILFGWNIYDTLSVELQGRYATNLKSGRREHIATGNVYGKYTFILDKLTDFKNLRILPFVKLGAATRFSVLPGNVNSDRDTVTQYGFGPSPGAGIAFLAYKYFYFGIDLQGDLLIFDDIKQTVNNVPGTLVYRGGFHPSFSGMLMVGVHY
ncbi:MAG: hypothetical protein HN337_10145 [Deltaproteobacteria bacterium]|jgi:hypothetical protein|nr:hypothetical protein [Deltaproteobacteria bacterium]